MIFTQIQDKSTKEIIMHLIDGMRVSKAKYREEERIKEMQGKLSFPCLITSRTRSGNFRHEKMTNI